LFSPIREVALRTLSRLSTPERLPAIPHTPPHAGDEMPLRFPPILLGSY
jgi:hypothetical protein